MIKILLLISSLETGGAERQLVELAKGLDTRQFRVVVATCHRDRGHLRSELHGTPGIEVVTLCDRTQWRRADIPLYFYRLIRVVHQQRPHVIYSFFGLLNEMALLSGRLFGAKVLWGIRGSSIDTLNYSKMLSLFLRLSASLSKYSDLVIANSNAGKTHFISHGYSVKNMVVIHNGINADRFRPNTKERNVIRTAWRIKEAEPLIGVVGRLHPMKDHRTFLKAAHLLVQRRQDVHFVCVGGGSMSSKKKLERFAASLGLERRIIWAGIRSDMPQVYNALDLLCSSSSIHEGFSNVVGEAMACGKPCVVTDVGDSPVIVGDTGIVVPPKNPQALASGFEGLLDEDKHVFRQRCERARKRIQQYFSVSNMVERTSLELQRLFQ